jgi:histidine ammonia-lyase
MEEFKIELDFLHEAIAERVSYWKKNKQRLRASRAIVENAIADGKPYYGINTGFGVLAKKRIPADQLRQLQKNIVLSHAIGVGDLIPRDITRLMLQLKIHSLALGYSGISEPTFDRLVYFAENDLIPAVPRKGSVGASGDLAPLAHLCLPLLGEGEFWDAEGKGTVPAAKIMSTRKLKPVELAAKDGLALINGTQMMLAYGAYVLHKVKNLIKVADILAACCLEALGDDVTAFDSRIQDIRPHPGQKKVASNVRRLVENSEILGRGKKRGKIQDPYSLRCVPQVHGASRDALEHCNSVIETEINSVTDNPLVFEDGEILSGGNFHGQPLALAMDYAAIALAEIASISERRINLLLTGYDGLPTLLMKNVGINSGFMIAQYTAAALASENKVLCHPASVDSIPTSLGQEDHVSMGSVGALKLFSVFKNVERVLGIEMLVAAQAMDYEAPRRPGRGTALAYDYIRTKVHHVEDDQYFGGLLENCIQIVKGTQLVSLIEAEIGTLS